MTDCSEHGNDCQIHKKDSSAWCLLRNKHGDRVKQEGSCPLSFMYHAPLFVSQ